MVLTEIWACLISEEVRPEPRGKFTVLGLYGVAPHVRILVKGFTPIPRLRLSFAFFGKVDSGTSDVELVIVSKSSGEIAKVPKQTVKFLSHDRSTTLLFNMMGVGIAEPGDYEARLLADGELVSTAPFEVREGEAPP